MTSAFFEQYFPLRTKPLQISRLDLEKYWNFVKIKKIIRPKFVNFANIKLISLIIFINK